MKKITITVFIALLTMLLLSSCGEKTYTGSLCYTDKAQDETFGISADSPILIREVEMVQYYKDESGVRLVLANYPIESFEDNGKTYTNPSFDDSLSSKVFYSEISIDEMVLSEDLIYSIANSENIEKIKLTDLPEDAGLQNGLVIVDGSYVTASDDWNPGDIKISYYYIDPLTCYTIKSKVKDNILIYTESFEISTGK